MFAFDAGFVLWNIVLRSCFCLGWEFGGVRGCLGCVVCMLSGGLIVVSVWVVLVCFRIFGWLVSVFG